MAETVQGITRASQKVSSPAPLHRLMTRETPGRGREGGRSCRNLATFFNYARQCRGTNCGRRDIITGERGGNERVGRARDQAGSEEMMRKRPVYLVSILHP